MWSTNPIFLPCPKHFRFWSLKSLEGDIVEGLDSSFHPSWAGPQLSMSMPSSSFGFCYDLIDSIISSLFIWILYFRMTYKWSCWIYVRAMPILWYPFRWYELRQLLRLFYIFIHICAIKVEDYVTFLYEGSMYTRYEYILCVCRGLRKPPSRDNKSFKIFRIFQPMNVMTWN